MNSKKAKFLRKMARQVSFNPETKESLPARRLMVLPAHEKRAQEKGMAHVTAINDPRTTRGAYRWLKENHHDQ